ncbi:GGDEF domain-containing protein [Clostridium ljungdahlii]|uniref:Phytochrome-like protein cph2 n=1 Tax=Clostridium ljungdahlii TaxID=1538 RepID=A0A162KW49_9CLOT|nr:diguanylate cyclase [Clostridium ljungdahlii]OAA84926.1 Phytochrome-like protein cph2 [Clostridium ljungdahlii]
MFFKIFRLIRSFILTSVLDKYKEEFAVNINEINLTRGKITAVTFIVIEVVELVILFTIRENTFPPKTHMYYAAMDILLILTMIVYLIIFVKLENNISKHGTSINVVGVSFTIMILFWCAGISLLDQLSSGQIIVYAISIIAVAVTPIFKPITLLLMYLIVHLPFLFLLPYFQKSSDILWANCINSTTFLIISWMILCMRYKNQVDDFNNRKIIQKKNDELERVNQKLEKLSQIDSLTGIFNRFVFDKTIEAEWDRCKRYFIPLSLIMIDIDFFKAFNDSYGHQAGDDCLRQVSRVLSSSARRSSDIVARYGGEEFAVVLTYMKKESVLEFAEQLRKKVEQLAIPHRYSSISNYITISLGICTVIPSDMLSIEQFIKNADEALYEAKKCRNKVVSA